MKYYSRQITKRVAINRFGKLGFKTFIECVKTNNIDKFNKGKQIKFKEDNEYRKQLRLLDVDRVYNYDIEEKLIKYYMQ